MILDFIASGFAKVPILKLYRRYNIDKLEIQIKLDYHFLIIKTQ